MTYRFHSLLLIDYAREGRTAQEAERDFLAEFGLRRNLLASATGVGREPSLGFALTVGCGDRNHAASGGMGG